MNQFVGPSSTKTSSLSWLEEMGDRTDGYLVTRPEVRHFLHGSNVTGTTIDAILYILHCFNQSPYRWQFVSTEKTHVIPHLDMDRVMTPPYRQFTKENLTTTRWIFIPARADMHWLLVVIDLHERAFKVYNSANADAKYNVLVQTIIGEWRHFLQDIFGPMDFQSWSVKPSMRTKHVNRDDCGLFVAKYVDCIVGHRPLQLSLDEVRGDRGWLFYNLIAAAYWRSSFPMPV